MANAGTVNVNLVAETAQFIANINKAVSTIKYLKAAELAFDKGSQLAGWMANQIQLAKEYSKAGTAVADALGRQADNLGITARAMASFTIIEHRADLAAGSLSTALSNMQKMITESAERGSAAQKTFTKLGLSFSDLIGLSADEQFKLISEAISKIGSASERTSETVEVFGKVGKGLVSTMTDGKKAFDDAAVAANGFGLALSNTEQARILKAEEKVKELAIIIKGYQQKVAAATAEQTAATAAYDKMAAENEANTAKSMTKAIGWWDSLKATVNDFMETDRSFTTRPKEDFKYVSRWADTMKDAVREVREAGEKADDVEASKKVIDNTEKKLLGIKEQKRIIEEMGAVRIKLDDDQFKRDDKTMTNYLGAKKAIQGIVAEWDAAGKKVQESAFRNSGFDFVRGNYEKEIQRINELRRKSASEDPLIKDMIASNEIGNTGMDPKDRKRLEEIAKERRRVEEEILGAPDQNVEVLYQKKVALLKEELEINEADKKKKRLETEQNVQRAAYADFFGSLSTIAGAFAEQSAEMFMISKAASIIQAEINAWMTYSNILSNESLKGGFISAQAMAAVGFAAAQVAVVNIAKQQPPGRANGGAVSRGSLYEVAEKGPEILESGGRSYLLNGDKSGRVQPLGAGGTAPRITVNVNNLPGQTAKTTQGGTDESPTVTIDIIDGMVASSVANSRSQTSRAMQTRYGLNPARGAQ